jgi:hypothetical protein
MIGTMVPPVIKFMLSKCAELGFEKFVEKLKPRIYNPIDTAYNKAVCRWTKNDKCRSELAVSQLSNFKEFAEYLNHGNSFKQESLFEFFQLLEEELKKDNETYCYLLDLKTNGIEKKVEDLDDRLGNVVEKVSRLEDQLQELAIKQNDYRLIESAKASVKQVDAVSYIPRKCEKLFDENNYLDKYLHPDKYPQYSLVDFVLGKAGKGIKKFLLSGDAQSGKTTELRYLFHTMFDSGLYRLYYQEIKGWEFSLQDLTEVEQRETIVIIDALDEKFNDDERNTLFQCINSYAKRHPFLKMVVSCRSNFKEINYLDEFLQLQLLDLSWEESKQIIYGQSDNAEKLISEIENKELHGLTRTPLFLLSLIDCFQQKKYIPDDKSELYDYIINRQLEREDAKGIAAHPRMVNRGRIALESMAVGLQLMDKNAFSEEELLDLFDDEKQWTRIQQCGLVEGENNSYSFAHNSFKEYLASLFLDKAKSLGEIQKLCCFSNTKTIKPTWYNVIVIYLSRLSKENNLFNEIVGWLEKDNEDLLLYVDRRFIDENKRCVIFISILEECKRKGMLYGARNEGVVKALMGFGYGKDSVNYIIGELEQVTEYDTRVSNLLRCVQYICWPSLVAENPQNASKLKTLVFEIFKRFCGDRNAWAIWEPFETPYFYNPDTCERLLSIVRGSEQPNTLNSFIRFVYNAGLSNDYVDFITEKSEFVHDYDDDGVTCAVYPIWINESLKRVDSKEGVIKVLSFLEKGIKNRETRSDFVVKHKGVIDAVIVQAERLVPEEELTNMLIRIFEEGVDPITSYGEIYDFNKPIVSYLEKQGLSEQLFFYYAKKVVEFIQHEGLLSHKYSQCAACFATTERFDTFASNYFNTETGFISVRCLHSYLLDKKLIDYAEVINVYYPDFVCYLEDRVENKKKSNLKCLFEYESFKREVLLMLDEHPENRKELSKRLYNYDGIEDQLNKYVYDYFNLFSKKQEYEFDRIREYIENKDFYKWFLLHETMGFMLSDSKELSIRQRQEVSQIAKDFIIRFVDEDGKIDRRYVYNSIELMMKGYIRDIDDSCLIKLLPYSSDFVFDNVTLFQYIVERPGVKTQTVMDFILSKINSGEKVADFTLNKWAGFIIGNKIENAYPLVVEWAINDQWGEIIPMLIEEPTARKLIINKTILNRFSVKNKLDVFWNLVIKTKNEHEVFVKGELESIFDEIEDENEKTSALRMLLMLGSIAGLQYITKHLEYYKKDRMLPNYSCEEALPMLFDSFDFLLEKRKEVEGMRLYESKMSVISSIGRIASHSQESFSAIENRIEELVLSDKSKYSELNYYVSQWKESLYSSNSKVWTIKDVKDMLKAYEIAS